uniref:Uncharacterized protein n=1 Tax=Arundo donax TaxID=35708 RepID=A0A0A9BJS6_ARUDO
MLQVRKRKKSPHKVMNHNCFAIKGLGDFNDL